MIRYILQKIYSRLNNRKIYLRPEINCKKEWYGNHYGGFYINPDLLNETSVVYSIGIGEDVSFDLDIINRHQSTVFGFDPTPKSINWVKKSNLPSKFIFFPYGIARVTGPMTFFLPKNENHVSGSTRANSHVNTETSIIVPMKSIQDVIKELGHLRIDILKMDIEGAEYDIIPGILNSNLDIQQLIVEFHHRLIPNARPLTKKTIKILKLKGFKIFAVSKSGDEVSFLNTKAITCAW